MPLSYLFIDPTLENLYSQFYMIITFYIIFISLTRSVRVTNVTSVVTTVLTDDDFLLQENSQCDAVFLLTGHCV